MHGIFSKPKISVIIGVLNMRNFLRTALNSVINQHYPHYELIIMDGGSTDGTLDLIEEYKEKIFFFESKPDKGHPDACNQAINYATGDFIVFLSADDYFEADLFNKVAATLHLHPHADIITCGARIVEKNKSNTLIEKLIFNDPKKLQLTFYNALFEFTAFNARFYRRNLFSRFGKFNAYDANNRVNRANDREFLIRLALEQIRTEIIPEPLYVYFSHEGASSFSTKNLERIHSEHLLLANQLLKDSRLTFLQKNDVKLWQARDYFYLCLIQAREKKFKKALKTFFEGLLKRHVFYINQIIRYCIKKCK